MPTPPWVRAAFHCLFSCAVVATASAQGGAWISRPELLDADGYVYDLLVYQGELIAAGDFEHIGGVAASGLAAFDGANWRPLGEPLRFLAADGTVLNSWVASLAEFRGELVAGGLFTHVGTLPASTLARWDGQSMQPLGGGTNGRVVAMTVHGNRLIVGGYFTLAGGVPAQRVASFHNGFAAMDNGFGGGVTALCSASGVLWAGGLFTQSGARATDHVARWNDGAWVDTAPGFDTNDSGDQPAVFAIREVDGELYALGFFHRSGSTRLNGIARWNGVRWESVGGGLGTTGDIFWGTEIVGYEGALYVGGRMGRAGGLLVNNIARYEGGDWSPLGNGTDDEVKAMAVFQGDLYVGGIFTRAGNRAANHLAQWRVARTPPARSDFALRIYPNPAPGLATFELELPADATVEFLLCDLRGRVLRRWQEASAAARATLHFDGFDLDGDRLASGRYLLTARAGGTEITRSFVLSR